MSSLRCRPLSPCHVWFQETRFNWSNDDNGTWALNTFLVFSMLFVLIIAHILLVSYLEASWLAQVGAGVASFLVWFFPGEGGHDTGWCARVFGFEAGSNVDLYFLRPDGMERPENCVAVGEERTRERDRGQGRGGGRVVAIFLLEGCFRPAHDVLLARCTAAALQQRLKFGPIWAAGEMLRLSRRITLLSDQVRLYSSLMCSFARSLLATRPAHRVAPSKQANAIHRHRLEFMRRRTAQEVGLFCCFPARRRPVLCSNVVILQMAS